MRSILKGKWLVLFAWIAILAVLLITMPNFNDLVRDKGELTVPDNYSSSYAAQLLKEMKGESDTASNTQIAVVFHNPQGLTSTDTAAIKEAIEALDEKQVDLGISSVTSHFFMEELEEQMVSADGKTILAALDVDINDRDISDIKAALTQTIDPFTANYYLTGEALINEDNIISAQEGLKKTEFITIGFILLVLLLVFRSIVTPFIPLLTVGFTYLVSQAILGFLVDWFNFPVSTFSQIFLVAILFGIGTDYCILLLSRFKEELGKTESINDAIVETYRTAGKTVFFSALAVLVGFSSIGFSTFSLYRSAAGVAVGIAILVIALYTLVPFFMSVLGKKVFWPAKGSIEHKQSKLWENFGRFALGKPILSLLLVAILVVPFLFIYDGTLSFNSIEEIGEDYDSIKGFNIISESFQPGESLPGTLVIKNKEPFDTPENLAMIENISRELAKLEGIGTVRSATRPLGEELEDFLVSNQVQTLNEGLDEAGDGLRQISDGLAQASSEINASSPELEEAAAGVGTLIQGTQEIKQGVDQLAVGLQQLEQGLQEGHTGSTQLLAGLKTLQENAELLATSSTSLLDGYKEMQGGLTLLAQNYQEIETQIETIAATLEGLQAPLAQLSQRYPDLQQDMDFLTVAETIRQLQGGSNQLAEGLATLNTQLDTVASGFEQANAGFEQIVHGNQGISRGLIEIVAGMDELAQGILQAANGQSTIVQHVPQLSGGLAAIGEGQAEIQQGFEELGGQLSELTNGLDQSVDGLLQVSDGLTEAQSYLTGLAAGGETAGMYIPQEALELEEFESVLDMYLSEDGYITKLDIIFADNPYATESLDIVPEIEAALLRVIQGTSLEQAEFGISGVTGTFSDLRQISSNDYNQTVVIMLIGIFLILIILLRSFVAPIYLIVSLILCYYTSIAITEFIFVTLLGYSGLTWAMPFFGFVVLVALGIDYSIFLMDRFREYRHLPIETAMLESMKNMGTVILSAAIILAGTFAAMLPSGMLSLLQIASVVIIGLLLYAVVFLPFFVPVMVKLFGKANFWPFKNEQS